MVLPRSPVKALVAPVNMLSLILSRWPRKRSQNPAGEMWSVVVFPFVLRSRGIFTKSASTLASNGARIWRRSLFGSTFTATPEGSSGGST